MVSEEVVEYGTKRNTTVMEPDEIAAPINT